jgi:hypothetical protein
MFIEQEEPAAPPLAQGAYWLLMPVAVVLAIPGLIRFYAWLFDLTLGGELATFLEAYEATFLTIVTVLERTVERVLPTDWHHWSSTMRRVVLFSLAGGCYIAGWFAASLQRRLGWFLGAILAIVLALALGASLLGLAFLFVAYFILTDGPVIVFEIDSANDWAILFPLLAPPILAAAFLLANWLT